MPLSIPDLSQFSDEQLRELLAAIPVELSKRKQEERQVLLAEMREIAMARGFTLEEVIRGGSLPTAKAKHRSAPKYQHPDDSALSWTGRGRKPGWMLQLLESGHDLHDLIVKH